MTWSFLNVVVSKPAYSGIEYFLRSLVGLDSNSEKESVFRNIVTILKNCGLITATIKIIVAHM